MLTIYSTLTTLIAEGVLWELEADLDPGAVPFRRFYATDVARVWLGKFLPDLPRIWDADAEPIEQVDALLQRYAAGKALFYGDGGDIRCLRPWSDGIWEFKTPDVRIFGWFPIMDIFVATNAKDAETVKRLNLYGPMVAEAVRTRAGLGMPFITGDDINVVLSAEN